MRRHFLIVSNSGNHKLLHFLLRQKGHIVAHCREVKDIMEVARSHADYHEKKDFDFIILNFNSDDLSIQREVVLVKERYPNTNIVFLPDITVRDFLNSASA